MATGKRTFDQASSSVVSTQRDSSWLLFWVTKTEMANIMHRSCPHITYTCHQDGFHNSASYWTQSALDFCHRYRSCSHPLHLTDLYIPSILPCKYRLDLPLLTHRTAASVPSLISLLNYHSILNFTSFSSVSIVRITFLTSTLTMALTSFPFSSAPNSHRREFSNYPTSQSDVPGPTSKSLFVCLFV